MEAIVGPWGLVFISIGLLISIAGNYLSWSLLAAEVLHSAARNQTFPSFLAHENANKVPANALWATNVVVQLIVVTTYWSRDAFSLMLNLTSSISLIPFVLVAAYSLQLCRRGETYDVRPEERRRDLIIAVVATIYTLFMLYAGGLTYILLAAVLYAPGSLLYVWARREQGRPVFVRAWDWLIFGLTIAGAAVGIHWLATGYITL